MDEIICKAVLIHSATDVEVITIKVNEIKHLIIRAKLEEQRLKIVNILKSFQRRELIKTVKRPKNKKMQKELNNLVNAKRTIDKTIKTIKEVFTK